MRGGLPVIVLFVLLLILIVTYMFYVSFILCFLKCVMYFVAGGGLLYAFIFICEYGLLPLCWMLDSTVGPREGADGGAKERCSWTTVS
jgi:hypothetical protein